MSRAARSRQIPEKFLKDSREILSRTSTGRPSAAQAAALAYLLQKGGTWVPHADLLAFVRNTGAFPDASKRAAQIQLHKVLSALDKKLVAYMRFKDSSPLLYFSLERDRRQGLRLIFEGEAKANKMLLANYESLLKSVQQINDKAHTISSTLIQALTEHDEIAHLPQKERALFVERANRHMDELWVSRYGRGSLPTLFTSEQEMKLDAAFARRHGEAWRDDPLLRLLDTRRWPLTELENTEREQSNPIAHVDDIDDGDLVIDNPALMPEAWFLLRYLALERRLEMIASGNTRTEAETFAASHPETRLWLFDRDAKRFVLLRPVPAV